MEVAIFDDTKTLDLMDRFEGKTGGVAYMQLVLRNIAFLKIGKGYEYISLVVERSKDDRYLGDITFTKLKKGETKDLYDFIQDKITKEVVLEYKNKNNEYRFDTPYLFRAQNSSNRSGYGWGYGGTQYGETTAYVFVGAYIGYRAKGFTDRINENLDNADMSEFTIKNKSNEPKYGEFHSNSREIIIDDDSIDEIDDNTFVETELNNSSDVLGIEFITEKRSIPADDGKPLWFYSGFCMEINLFILALEQRIYLPPIIDECERRMQTDENTRYNPGYILTDMEKTFMFVEMLANSIGYSGLSVMGLDIIHKRKILENILIRNVKNYEYGEYGDDTISFHLAADFLENQPELRYTGYVEIILSKYQNEKGDDVYELTGGFKDFGENEIKTGERHYWIGKDTYLLDEDGSGSYLQGIYEMAVNYYKNGNGDLDD